MEDFMLIKKLSDNSKEYLDAYYEIIDSLKSQMFAVEICDSISKAYIEQILPLANAGILLSENILKYTTDTEIEALAKGIIEANNNNIETLNAFMEECACVTNSDRDVKLYTRKATEIITNMITRFNSIQGTNNLNSLYLQALIYHHEGELQLAKNALNYDICDKLKIHINEHLIKISSQLALLKNLLNNYRR